MSSSTNIIAPEIKTCVEQLLQGMTLAEKAGQMTQVEKNSITPADVAAYGIGSVLSGGGGNPSPNTPASWARMVRSFQEGALKSRMGIPLIYGTDAVHGHSNLRGAVIFPHNIGLGATRDEALVERIGKITATELLATNVHWTFAPSVAVAHDIRWGRTYESYSEDAELVSRLGAALIRGLKGGEKHPDSNASIAVLPSVKHYVADGGTRWRSTAAFSWLEWWPFDKSDSQWVIDQGDSDIDEATLRRVHLPPYQAAIEAGALNIMVSYSSWHGLKMHAHKHLLTDVLKGELGFEGFLVSDYLALNQLAPNYEQCVVMAINAGLDMVMVPFDYKRFLNTLVGAVDKGLISIKRIDDAVCRILTAKFALGLFEHPFGEEALLAQVGSSEHRQVAREAVRKSLVLLKNDRDVLPLSKNNPTILIAGEGADDIGMQCGGWTIEWMGGRGPITSGTTILQGIRQVVDADTTVIYSPSGEFETSTTSSVGIVVVGEPPYVEGHGDTSDLSLSTADKQLIHRMRAQCQQLVVIILSGRPLIITDVLVACDACVAAWLPGTEGTGVADVLFGDYPSTGKLPFSWPQSMDQLPLSALRGSRSGPLFSRGYGIQTDNKAP
jgi:beta-glucosidase